MIKSQFLPHTTLEMIVSQLLIEDLVNSTDFISYYNRCSPSECTDSFIQDIILFMLSQLYLV